MDTAPSPPIAYRGAGIRTQHPAGERPRWDWRRLLNGKGNGMIYERAPIAKSGWPFAGLKKRSFIDAAAKEPNDPLDFSRLIREDHPGMESLTLPTKSNLMEP